MSEIQKKPKYSLDEIKSMIDKEPQYDIIKTASISFDNKSYLVRIPSEVVTYFRMTKKDKLRFIVDVSEANLKVEVVKNDKA